MRKNPKPEPKLVLERAGKGLCPICVKQITTEFKVEEYSGKKVWICKEHPIRNLSKKTYKRKS